MKNVCQGPTASTDCLCINSGNAPHSASLDKPTRGFPGSDPRSATRESAIRAELSPGPVDNPLSLVGDLPHAFPMAKVDGCPECVRNTEPPKSAVKVAGAWRCAYLCTDCGHAWTTDWRD